MRIFNKYAQVHFRSWRHKFHSETFKISADFFSRIYGSWSKQRCWWTITYKLYICLFIFESRRDSRVVLISGQISLWSWKTGHSRKFLIVTKANFLFGSSVSMIYTGQFGLFFRHTTKSSSSLGISLIPIVNWPRGLL